MASTVVESWGYADGCDHGSNDSEFSQSNHNLLMSLLDETQTDDCDDDERLEKVIRSLEDEINSNDCYEFDKMTWEANYLMDYQSSTDEPNGQDHSMQPNDFDDLCWVDVETTPPSGGWDEFGCVKNYAPISSEEQDYGSLWNETNVIM
ncbi:disease resistance protein [Striga asiatica]|uniref:Disease resistance protein n=1 Tax=Striga asiatica TaxID=4170 RepID=A0A5A7RC58_STRAF|nr:disease resistance protein [Striga asiatica]